jgi:hypothetical protein
MKYFTSPKKIAGILCFCIIFIYAYAYAGVDDVATMEFLGFSEDGKVFVVKVLDKNRGNQFQVLDVKDAQLVKAFDIVKKTEEDTLKKIKTKYKVKDPNPNQATSDGKFMLLTGPGNKGQFKIMLSNGKSFIDIKVIDLQKDQLGKFASAQAKGSFWHSDDKTWIVIYNQKLTGDFGIDRDFVVSGKINPLYLQFPQ